MLLLFTFGVQLLATEKNVWSTISYNPPIIVYWQVTALEKDLCLLAPACLAKSKAPLLGKVLLTTNHLPDLHITTSNNQNNNKPLIVLV